MFWYFFYFGFVYWVLQLACNCSVVVYFILLDLEDDIVDISSMTILF
jgi:hypothetical protein